MNFPIKIRDGKDIITFTAECDGFYESGEPCVSTLPDMMVRVEYGSAEIIAE